MDSRLPIPQPYRVLLPRGTESSSTKVPAESMDYFRRPEKPSPDWVTIYPHVRSMYQIQGFKLREIMTHMEYTYGFKATRQMYKKQIKKWGLTKRAQRDATAAGTRSLTERMRRQYLLSRRDVNGIGITQQTQRRDISRPIIALELDVHTPEQALQQVLTLISNWVYGAIEMGEVKTRICSSSIEMYQTFTLAMELFSLDYGSLAGLAIRKVFIQLEDAIQDFNIDLTWNLVDMMYEMTMAGQNQLLGIFIRHFYSVAQQSLRAEHPLKRFASLMFRQTADQLNIIRVYNSKLLDQLAGHVSPQLYRQELHDSCIVRLQRQACLVPDVFITGIWNLKRSHINTEGYAQHWDKILSTRPQASEALRIDVMEIRSLAAKLLLQEILWHEDELYRETIILDAKRRLAWIEMNDGGVLSSHTNDNKDKVAAHGEFQKEEATSALHILHEILAIERHFRLTGLENEAYQLREDLIIKVEDFLDDILHDKTLIEP
nr:hypothetical protein [Trichoderma atroviride]